MIQRDHSAVSSHCTDEVTDSYTERVIVLRVVGHFLAGVEAWLNRGATNTSPKSTLGSLCLDQSRKVLAAADSKLSFATEQSSSKPQGGRSYIMSSAIFFH
jgi:hypothetical protein